MRIVVQRVTRASVSIGGEMVSSIGKGLMVLIGVEVGDTEQDAVNAADKMVGLRIFEDDAGKLNRSVQDVGGEILAVSQFTLLGDARHGRRPSFIRAARPEQAEPLFEKLVQRVSDAGIPVATGRFRTHMEVSLVNDGPVTILLDSKKGF